MNTSTRNQILMAHIFCVGQQFCSVAVYVIGKKVMEVVDAHMFVFMRLLFVIPIVLIFAWLLTRKFVSFKVPLKPVLFMASSGIIGILISQSLMFAGLDKSTATNTSIISAPCTPLFTALFSVLRGTDKMNVAKGLGFVSSIAGAMLLLQVWNFKFEGTTLGNLLIVGSSLCSAVNALLQKHVLNQGYHPLVVQSYVVTSGALLYTIGYAPFGLFEPHAWILPSSIWMYIAIVGIVATGLPWCLGIIALKHTSPMTTSVYVVLQPLIAGFVGVVIMGEVLTWIQMLGSALVLLGLVFVNATPIVHKIIALVKLRVSGQQSKEFVLLESESESEDRNVELESLSENSIAVSSSELKYEFAGAETNTFVIAGEQDTIESPTSTPYYYDDVIIIPSAAVITIPNGADNDIIVLPNKDNIPTAILQPILVA